jgi:ubiquinone/menaquinone biosynthesis C-methylase UbiE
MPTAHHEVTLSPPAVKALYDRIGRWQDTQRFYEDVATADLIAHANLGDVRSVFEFGVGTGRLAERLLRDHLPPATRYHGIDVSSTMVALARERLSPWASRVTIVESDGSPRIDTPDGQYDRVVSTYVLDLLSRDDIAAVLAEARRVLSPGGLVCLVSATHGRTTPQRLVMGLATRLHALSPTLVGGCRAIDLSSILGRASWRLVHHQVVSKWGIPSEVVVASPRRERTS